MNHEEIYHLRDKYMIAVVGGMLADSTLPVLSIPEFVKRAEELTSEIMKRRSKFYEAQDKK